MNRPTASDPDPPLYQATASARMMIPFVAVRERAVVFTGADASENFPARLPAAGPSPTISRTSATLDWPMELLAASAARCARADRPGWKALDSSSPPASRSGQRS
jgi:hypothetical protein